MGKSSVGEGSIQPLGVGSGVPSNQPKMNGQIASQRPPMLPQAVPSGVPSPARPATTPAEGEPQTSQDTSPNAAVAPAKVDDYNLSSGKSYRVLAGTVIETVLLNRINSDFSGPVNCMVTSPVYSHDRQRVLLPEGTQGPGRSSEAGCLGTKACGSGVPSPDHAGWILRQLGPVQGPEPDRRDRAPGQGEQPLLPNLWNVGRARLDLGLL